MRTDSREYENNEYPKYLFAWKYGKPPETNI